MRLKVGRPRRADKITDVITDILVLEGGNALPPQRH
jgi:hypothetical protein